MSSEEKGPYGSMASSAHPTPMDTSPTGSDGQLYPNNAEKGTTSAAAANPKAARSSNWKKYAVIGVIALIVVVLAVVLPVYFLVIKKKDSSSSGTSGGGGGGSSTDGEGVVAQPGGVTSGTDGSVVFTENGNFTYVNKFGGRWSYDPANPFANGAFQLSPLGVHIASWFLGSIAQCVYIFRSSLFTDYPPPSQPLICVAFPSPYIG